MMDIQQNQEGCNGHSSYRTSDEHHNKYPRSSAHTLLNTADTSQSKKIKGMLLTNTHIETQHNDSDSKEMAAGIFQTNTASPRLTTPASVGN